MSQKNHLFKAEIQQMLDLVIHSLYSKKEIFLRELISNASDAIDRAQYLGLTDATLVTDQPTYKITIVEDKDNRTLTISDNGMGMNEADMEVNLGVIASSGTKAFTQAMKEKDGAANLPELIGQFGVGFYAAFMVADKVTVVSLKRGVGEQAASWASEGNGSYTVDSAEKAEPGTVITLHIREGMDEYLETWKIRELIKTYSDFIAYPILLGEKGEQPKDDAEPLNTMKALWKRAKNEIKPEEYSEFYKHLTHDYTDPLKVIHTSVEGVVEFKALLFLPKDAGFDLYMPNTKHGLNLYVRNVFIGADFDLLLPEYLRFVKGVVDSSDLPLNVSREMLQDDAVIRKIKSNITSKVLSTLAEMMKNDLPTYKTFFATFGRILKEGVHSDYENADKIKALLLYPSAKSAADETISLANYVAAMPEAQKDIYFLIADSVDAARRSPQIEAATKHGCDVLFFTDPVDQWLADSLREFDGKKFVAIDKGDIDFGTEEEKAEAKKARDAAADTLKPLMDAVKEQLKDTVSDVRLSTRLTGSACCLVANENALSPAMERMMRAMKQDVPKQLRTLELNPEHPLVQRMCAMADDDAKRKDYIDLLYAQALLAEGSTLPDPQRFNALLAGLMV